MLFDNLLSKHLENEKSFLDETNYVTYLYSWSFGGLGDSRASRTYGEEKKKWNSTTKRISKKQRREKNSSFTNTNQLVYPMAFVIQKT